MNTTILNSSHTFDTFVVGSSNQLAYNASFSIGVGDSDKRYNPIIIYGETGLGKTHLLHAIGNNKNLKIKNLFV